jgi:hypothetical protein
MAVTEKEFRLLRDRLGVLERRVIEIETAFGESLYRMERRTIRLDIAVTRILGHLGIPEVADAEVDAAFENGASE